MRIPVLLSLACMLCGPAAGAATPPVIILRVMAQESLPPKWLLRDGRADGVCPDILAAIEKIEPRLRFRGQTELRSIPAIERALDSGNIDCSCALLDTDRRRQIAVVAGPALYVVRHKLAAAIGDKVVIDNFDDLVRIRPLITTSRGAGYSDQLRVMGLKVDDSTGDNLVNLKKIIAGHGRIFYMNDLTLNWLVREYGLDDKVRILPSVMREEPVFFWVGRKTPPASARLVDQALWKLKASGELARIYGRWAAER
jgi:polar amino acid transport system substrate-binding protein